MDKALMWLSGFAFCGSTWVLSEHDLIRAGLLVAASFIALWLSVRASASMDAKAIGGGDA